jgi:hypothetical protein
MKDNTGIICYDLELMPEGVDVSTLFSIMNTTNLLFYDSFRKKAIKSPYVVKGTTSKFVVDVSTADNRLLFDKMLEKFGNGKIIET